MNVLETKYPTINNSLYATISDAILIETNQRLVHFANQAFCNLFKLKKTAQSITGLHTIHSGILSSFVFKNPSKFLNRIDEIIENGKPVLQEPIYLQSGELMERDFLVATLENNNLVYIWLYKKPNATNTYLPRQQNIPVSLMKNNEALLYKQVLHVLPLPFAIVNAQQEYVFANTAYEPNFTKRNYLIGKTSEQFASYFNMPNTKALLHNAPIQLAIQNMQLQSIEEAVAHKNYTTYFLPFTTNNNETFIAKYSIDITHFLQQQHQLEYNLQLYKQIVNKVNNLVLVANHSLEPTFINTTWQHQLLEPLAIEEVENIFKTISLTNYAFYKQVFELLNGDSQGHTGKIQLTQDNKKRWYNYSLETNPLNQKDKNLVAILNDITKEVELEENLLEVVKREKELNDLKSAFVNMVSHELRTPLAVIASGAEIIGLMLQAGKPTENIHPYIQQITDEVERMTTFMNDLLMVSKIEAGKIEFAPTAIAFTNFIRTVVATHFLPYKDGRHLQITTKGIEHEVAVDEKMIRHVLQNVVDNAFKYSLHQQAPLLRIRYGKTHVTISIVDGGIGIPEDDMPKLFSSFSRGKNVADIAGTGIGLVVVKYFVELHKGSIQMKSKEGMGTIFSIKIPYKNG